MIELIQSIFSEGDFIKILLNDSNKSVEGVILKLLPTSIAIKTKEGKICGVKGDNICSFEEGVLVDAISDKTTSKNQADLSNPIMDGDSDIRKEEFSCPKKTNISCEEKSCTVNSEEISQPVGINSQKNVTNNTKDTSIYKPGDIIPLELLHRIDPKLKNKTKISGKMKPLGKGFDALAVLVKDQHEADDQMIVAAVGEIKAIYPSRNFGFIHDSKSGKDIYFSLNQIIDNSYNPNTWVHIPVVYSVQEGQEPGPKAMTIHRPKTVRDIIAIAHEFSKQGEYLHAFHLIEQVINQYPDNFSADQYKRELERLYPHYNSKPKEYSNTYNNAKKYHHSEKNYEKAIEYYLKAIEKNEKTESAIKDLGMLYAQLAKSEENKTKSEKWRTTAIQFMKKYAYKFSDSVSTLYYLENFYYSIQEFGLFIETAEDLLTREELQYDRKRRVQLLCKIAVAYIQTENIGEATNAIDEALRYDPSNNSALKLKTAIDTNDNQSDIIKNVISATEFDALNSGLSSFIQQTLDEYEEYAGVKTKDIESRYFTSKTLKDVRDVIEKAGTARARERAAYLLTEGKLMQVIEPSEELKLRTVMAKYCNAMALSNISDNSSMDIIRFFYNEAFTLEESWDSNVRQVALYLLTHKHGYSELITDSGKNNSIESTLDIVLRDGYDNKIWDSILTMMLNNISISAQMTFRLFEKSNWKKQAIDALRYFGVNIDNDIITQTLFKDLWNQARELRLREYQKVVASIKTAGDSTSIEELILKLYEINNFIKEWMCPLDKRRVHDIVNSITPAIDSYIQSSGYRNKETNKSYANALIQQLIGDIKKGPTRFSYEAILPLMESVQQLLLESFTDIVKMSEPRLSMRLLATENVVNPDQSVNIQISISNHKDSSPIREVSVSIKDSDEVALVQGEATAYNALEGGENQIFKIKVKVSEKVVQNKATAVTAICKYKSGEEIKIVENQLSLRLYTSNDFMPIKNPYAPIADGGPVPVDSKMFYGREEFISNIVDAIIKSPSKQIIIYGQKRCGKSSVMLHLKKRLLDTGKTFCIFFSIGEIINNLTEASFYYKILKTIQIDLEFAEFDGFCEPIPSFNLPSLADFKSEDEENPLNTFTKYMVKFKLACKNTPGWEDKNLVVMIDEFTYLYTEIKKGNISPSIMKQWKAVTQNERAQFSVVLVGQDVVPSFKKEDYARNAFGVIQDIRLTYLKETPARDLIEKPILDEDGNSRYIGDAVSKIIEYTSRNPYYIQIFCARLVDYMNANKLISVTEADVVDVANSFIYGSEALVEDKFDNLIRAGETEDLQEYPETEILQVLKQVSLNSKIVGFCNRNDINALADKDREDAILRHLVDREVLELRGENNYKIQVKLFQEWLLNH